jgi:asparagine synthase (glutamine-hydrolysing)
MCRLLVQCGYDGSKEQYKDFVHALSLMKNGGPDNTTIIERDGILFGHNRLSIIDLSDAANQPFETEKYILLFNGEIYNYQEARVLYRLNCKTDSDTEVIVRMIERFGISALKSLYGEYAIVLYDKDAKEFHFATDPSGIKPLYRSCLTSTIGNTIIASEEKAVKYLLDKKGFTGEDQVEISSFLKFGFFPTSSRENIDRVRKGYVFKKKMTDLSVPVELELAPYFSIKPAEVKDNLLRQTIEKSVKERMRSDVPIACALSGGIDSAVIAYLMSKHSDRRIKTYTIGFKGLDNEFDEAQEMARFIGSDHYEIEIDPKEIIENLDDILETMEGPIDRGSLIPTYFLAKNVKEKVILTGEGSDEIFGGYKRHQEIFRDRNLDLDQIYEKFYECFKEDEVYPQFRETNRNTPEFPLNKDLLRMDLKYEIPMFHCQRLDRCFMRFGIECRVPFLDQLLIDTALAIPKEEKMEPEKKCLREAFRGKIPDRILDRKKKPLKLPFEYMIEMEEVKKNILEYDNPWIKKEAIEEIYNSPPESRNRGRKLWTVYLINRWYEKQRRS